MSRTVINVDSILLKLKSTPNQSKFETHYWSDYIELRCLFNPDLIFTKDDFLDTFRSNKDFSPNYMNGEDDSSGDSFFEDEPAYKNDKEEAFTDECFSLFEYRMNCFREFYPFFLSPDRRALFRKKNFTWKHRCYLFLLLSSSLRYLTSIQSIFTSSFEVFSLQVLRTVLPGKAEAHFFGSSNVLIKNKRYKGHTWDKLNKLKEDLNEQFILKAKSDFPKTDSGDAGFDFVAWIPNGDKQSHLITFIGQAACTDNWKTKQYSSSSLALSAFISVSVQPINIVFIPFSIRSENGHWRTPQPIVNSVLFDRQRLLYHFKNGTDYNKLPCDKIITELLKIKDSPYN